MGSDQIIYLCTKADFAVRAAQGRDLLKRIRYFIYRPPIHCRYPSETFSNGIIGRLAKMPLVDLAGRTLFPSLTRASLRFKPPPGLHEHGAMAPMTRSNAPYMDEPYQVFGRQCFLSNVTSLRLNQATPLTITYLARDLDYLGLSLVTDLSMQLTGSGTGPLITQLKSLTSLNRVTLDIAQSYVAFRKLKANLLTNTRQILTMYYVESLQLLLLSRFHLRFCFDPSLHIILRIENGQEELVHGMAEIAVLNATSLEEMCWLRDSVIWQCKGLRTCPMVNQSDVEAYMRTL